MPMLTVYFFHIVITEVNCVMGLTQNGYVQFPFSFYV